MEFAKFHYAIPLANQLASWFANGSLEMQDPKNRQKVATWATSHNTTLLGYIFATKARIDSRKKLVKQLAS